MATLGHILCVRSVATCISQANFQLTTIITLDIPKCTKQTGYGSRITRCSTLLFKKVKYGSDYKIIQKKLYSYYPIKDTLVKLYGRKGFHQTCELWRERHAVPDVYTDIYDGSVCKYFVTVDGKPFLSAPYNLCLKINVDWIQPFDHTQYSMELIHLAIENFPRSERFKVENIILVGCIPGPRESKQDNYKSLSISYI